MFVTEGKKTGGINKKTMFFEDYPKNQTITEY